MTSIPQVLILHILSRLPVKSLCRFQFVSRRWFRLINDPQFAKLHLNLNQRHKLLISTKLLYNIDLQTLTYDYNEVVAVEDNSLPCRSIPFEKITFIGSSHGLVCLELSGQIWLHNPSTKQSKHIPSPSFASMESERYGFGYIESKDDYVIVTFYGMIFGHAAVYSLRNDSWTPIEFLGTSMHELVDCHGIFLNGGIHSIATEGTDVEILVFDLVNYKIVTLALPEFDGDDKDSYYLGFLGGCLVFSTRYKFWIMKEYGIEKSWTRMSNVHPELFEQELLCYLNNTSSIVFTDTVDLMVSDAKGENVKKIKINGVGIEWFNCIDIMDINVYVESLVSPLLLAGNGQLEGLEYWYQ